ncbi:MAG: hypothetical protein IKR94_02115 [Bacteroidales bacterium]|nr:hypothetical protein [Bacteroidales bacterium]
MVKKNNEKKSGMSTSTKILIISGGTLILAAAVLLFTLGRVRVIDNSMENTIPKGETMWFNKLSSPDYNDVVAFHHPETDSIVASAKEKNYYKMCRMYGKSWVSKAEVITQDMNKRPIYLSRCIALPGDVVAFADNRVFVNKKQSATDKPSKQFYYVVSDGIINPAILDTIGLTKTDAATDMDFNEEFLNLYRQKNKIYTSTIKIYSMSPATAKKLQQFSVIKKVEPVVLPKTYYESIVFPYVKEDTWNESNLGPVLVPQEDKIIKLASPRIAEYYRRVIEAYEGNTMEIKGNTVLINGKPATSYRFKQNYYFVVSDNRATKNDSRFFGFLPEDHLVGVIID